MAKQTLWPRIKVRWRLPVFAAVLACSAALLIAHSCQAPANAPRVVTVVVPGPAPECPAPIAVAPAPEPEPLPEAEPEPASVPDFGPGSCAAPTSSKRFRGLPGDAEERIGTELESVAVSPLRPDHIAAASDSDVFVSTDDGRSFETLTLVGPPLAIDVDCRGRTLIVAKASDRLHLGIHSNGETLWRPLPAKVTQPEEPLHSDLITVIAGGGWIVVNTGKHFVEAEGDWRWGLMKSGDGGKTWRDIDLGDEYGELSSAPRVQVDGAGRVTVLATEEDCRYDGASVFRGSLASKRDLKRVNVSGTRQLTDVHVQSKWAYSFEACEDGKVCALDLRERSRPTDDWSDAEWVPIVNLPAAESCEDDLVSVHFAGDNKLFLNTGSTLYRLRNGKAIKYSDSAPPEMFAFDVDSRNRFVGLIDGELVRWSKRSGLRRLRLFDEPEPAGH